VIDATQERDLDDAAQEPDAQRRTKSATQNMAWCWGSVSTSVTIR
jgi:hypothetical protein